MMSKEVYFYMRPNCALCDEAEILLLTFQALYDFEIVKKNIEDDPKLLDQYFLEIPVVRVNDEELTAKDLSAETLDQFIKERIV